MNHVRNFSNDFQQVGLTPLLEHLLEFVTGLEVVFDRALATSGNDNDLVAAGVQRLLTAILNDWLVDQRQHLFGLGFRGRQKASAQPCRREYRLAYFISHECLSAV